MAKFLICEMFWTKSLGKHVLKCKKYIFSQRKNLKNTSFFFFFFLFWDGFMIFWTEVFEELWKMHFSSANSTNFAEIWGEKITNFFTSKILKKKEKRKENTNHHYCKNKIKLKLKTIFETMDAKSEQMGLGSPMHQIRAFKNEWCASKN